MSVLYPDTHPKIEQMQIEFIRRMPPWKKVAILNGLNETVKTLAITGIKQRNPNATPEQVHRMLAELMLGSELARKVYDRAR
ncbi:MAG TPA: death domain-containing protein [Anaerolineales bacterium]|nr:death domain-containing protein [Anaerolineales bacterium]